MTTATTLTPAGQLAALRRQLERDVAYAEKRKAETEDILSAVWAGRADACRDVLVYMDTLGR